MASTDSRDAAVAIAQLEQRLAALERSAQMGYSSVENGAIDVYDADGQLVQQVGIEEDEPVYSYVMPTVPPRPAQPSVVAMTESIGVTWSGGFESAPAVQIADIEVHASEIPGEMPSTTTYRGSLRPTGGHVLITASPLVDTEIRLVSVSVSGVSSNPTDPVIVQAIAPLAELDLSSDGLPPAVAPEVTAKAVPGFAMLSWAPLDDPADPIQGYTVHTSATSGFTADDTNITSRWGGTTALVRTLPDGSVMQPGQTYYAKVRAFDEDGSGPASTEVAVVIGFQGTPDIATGSIQASMLASILVLASTFIGKKPPAVITGKELTSNVATLRTAEPHGFVVGAEVLVTGVDATFNGLRTVTAVPNATSFSFARTASDLALTPTVGLADPSQRWEGDSDGIRFYDEAGDLTINLPTDASPENPASFYGSLVAIGLRVLDNLSIQGINNELAAGSRLRLKAGTTKPSLAPAVALTYLDGPAFDLSGIEAYSYMAWDFDDGYWWLLAYVGGNMTLHQFATTGGPPLATTVLPEDFGEYPKSLVKIGDHVYSWVDADGGRILYWNLSSLTDGLEVDDDNIRYGKDYVSGNLIRSFVASGTLRWQLADPATQAPIGGIYNPSWTTYLTAVDRVAADFGTARFVITQPSVGVRVYSTAATPVRQLDQEWVPLTTFGRAVWDGTRFVHVYNYSPPAPGAVRHKLYSSITWGAADSDRWWIGSTWRDSDVTAPDYANYETDLGSVMSITMKKRTFPVLSVVRLASSPVDAVTFYVGRGATQPAVSSMWRQPPPPPGAKSQTLTSVVLAGASPDDNPPLVNGFPGGTPSRIESEDGVSYLDANGLLYFPKMFQAGVVTITPSAANTETTVDVEFAVPFDVGVVPAVVPFAMSGVTIPWDWNGSGTDPSPVTGATKQLRGWELNNVTNEGFSLTIARRNTTNTLVGWIAMRPTQ